MTRTDSLNRSSLLIAVRILRSSSSVSLVTPASTIENHSLLRPTLTATSAAVNPARWRASRIGCMVIKSATFNSGGQDRHATRAATGEVAAPVYHED